MTLDPFRAMSLLLHLPVFALSDFDTFGLYPYPTDIHNTSLDLTWATFICAFDSARARAHT